jgi:NTP pyrophosphatase (non-canonical NTP hydrolase)
MGELGSELARLWSDENRQPAASRSAALEARRQAIGSELADCLAYLVKLANYTGIDLETAYLTKMQQNRDRTWYPPAQASPDED